jgi:ribose-phosphate pyrophosphokinase
MRGAVIMNDVTLQSFPDGLGAARCLASRLGIVADGIVVHRFPDGEVRVTVAAPTTTVLIYASLNAPNDKLIEILFAAEALRRNGALRIVLVAPYLCYMRQDTAFHPLEAISQSVVGRLLAGVVDRVVTVDAHLHRTHDLHAVFPGIAADDLSAMPAISDHLLASPYDPATVIVGPDEESRSWVSRLAARLDLHFTIAHKIRGGDRAVTVALDGTAVRNRPVLLVDDIVSSGGTLVECARALTAAGATAVDAIITHALFPADLIPGFAQAGIRSIRSTNSVPHQTNAIALDGVLATALQDEFAAPDRRTPQ